MPHTPSPDSDGLPFHPKYLNVEGYEAMSPRELQQWLHDDPCTPLMYGSQPTSAGGTRPVSPSAPDSPIAPVRRQLTTEGQYKPITCQAMPEGTPGPSRGCSPHSPLGALPHFTPLLSQVPLPEPDPTSGTSGNMSPEEYSPSDAASPGGHHYTPIIISPSEDTPRALGG
jgi:hypothetical protein